MEDIRTINTFDDYLQTLNEIKNNVMIFFAVREK